MKKLTIEELRVKANEVRRDIIEMLLAAESGHSAGPLGMADVFRFDRVVFGLRAAVCEIFSVCFQMGNERK